MYWLEAAWLIIALLLFYCVTGDTITKETPHPYQLGHRILSSCSPKQTNQYKKGHVLVLKLSHRGLFIKQNILAVQCKDYWPV